jgi:hypothetical protein
MLCTPILYLHAHTQVDMNLLTPPTIKCSHLKLVASELPPSVLITHLWPTVVQHTAAHARYVTHALRPKGGGDRGNPRERAGEASHHSTPPPIA